MDNFHKTLLFENYIPIRVDFQVNNPSGNQSAIYISELKILSSGDLIASFSEKNPKRDLLNLWAFEVNSVAKKIEKLDFKNEFFFEEDDERLANYDESALEDAVEAAEKFDKEEYKAQKAKDAIQKKRKLLAELRERAEIEATAKIERKKRALSSEMGGLGPRITENEISKWRNNNGYNVFDDSKDHLYDQFYVVKPIYEKPTLKENIDDFIVDLKAMPFYNETTKIINLGLYTKAVNGALLNLYQKKPQVNSGSVGFYSFAFLISKKIVNKVSLGKTDIQKSVAMKAKSAANIMTSSSAGTTSSEISIFKKKRRQPQFSESSMKELVTKIEQLEYFLEVLVSDAETGKIIKTTTAISTL